MYVKSHSINARVYTYIFTHGTISGWIDDNGRWPRSIRLRRVSEFTEL